VVALELDELERLGEDSLEVAFVVSDAERSAVLSCDLTKTVHKSNVPKGAALG
jgi:hypothetical protein